METCLKMLVKLILFCLVMGAALTEAPSGPDNCFRLPTLQAFGSDVECHLRTLDPEGRSLDTVPPEGTARLFIKCNPVLLFESSLRARYFQRLDSLTDLHIDNCKVLSVPDNTFLGLRDLKKLTFRSKNLEWSPSRNLELSPESFSGLRELHAIDLGFNNIISIPVDMFCILENLNSVNLTGNKIKSTNQLGFGANCGSTIQSLDLSHNEIKTLSSDSGIAHLRRLERLALQNNNITDLSGDAFKNLLSLRILNMSRNDLQMLPHGLFANNKELREIYLSNNHIVEIIRGIFYHLEQLLVLDLSGNQLTSNHIDDGTFAGLIRLVVLNLSHNALTRIAEKTFKDLFFLQILNLRNNSIGYIEGSAFFPLYNLHTLDLAENRLHMIDEQLFDGLFVLSKLTLNNNLLVSVNKDAFKNCSDLKELDLSSNQLTEIPQAISQLPFLKTLDLGENMITNFKNGSFRNLGQLTGLRLIENQIGNLSVGMFWDLPNLQVLNLAKNKIQSIERGAFARNTLLEAIRLDGNFMSDINGIFAELANLLWLNLSENHLVWFDYAFIPRSLKWLDIHGNFIEHLGNYYKIQSELNVKTLDASHNRLVEISSMSIPNSVELLFINNNFINNIHVDSFKEKKSLTRVDMYANDIQRLDLNSLRLSPVPANKSIPEFYIGGNPVHCDCTMQWLSSVNNLTAVRQYPRVMDFENVVCKMTHNRSAAYLPFTNLNAIDFLCSYNTHCFENCHCCDFDACDCKMACPRDCSCYHDPHWNTNIADCSRQAVSQVPQGLPIDATVVYLDGNNFKELSNHAFIGMKSMRALHINGSQIEIIQQRTFAGLNALELLDLKDNKLKDIYGYAFENLVILEELYLQNNLITFISNETFTPLISLKVLKLNGNKLVDYDLSNLNSNKQLITLSLGNNLWSCKCKFLQTLTSYIAKNTHRVTDVNNLWCWNSAASQPAKKSLNLNGTACTEYYTDGSVMNGLVSDNIPMLVSALTCFLLLVIVIIITFAFRHACRIWVYDKCGIRLSAAARPFEDDDKLYDAYVCYSPKDEEFVVRSLAGELENGYPSYHLCLHYRDIPQYDAVYAQYSALVVETSEASRRVILVLTRNFMQTEWSRFEFRQAFHEALKGRASNLIIIEEGPPATDATSDLDLKPYFKTSPPIRWKEKRFWERLRFALPSSKRVGYKGRSPNYRRSINTYTLDSSVPNATRAALAPPAKSPTPGGAGGGGRAPLYGPDGRPLSEHIYSSIDSDYSTLERNVQARHWPNCAPDGGTAQSYFV